jgi:hypothetical protein
MLGGEVRATVHGRGFSKVIRTLRFDLAVVESQAMAPVLPRQGHRWSGALITRKCNSDRLKNACP